MNLEEQEVWSSEGWEAAGLPREEALLGPFPCFQVRHCLGPFGTLTLMSHGCRGQAQTRGRESILCGLEKPWEGLRLVRTDRNLREFM